ncbi:putative UV-stimulated scaffold protein A [Helianthus annuus]|nr:putative UV-stimulated scaffold protein A [Helianthus annuus]KAJ0928236.1 putative UV-stimulated scaffold protein A [Helianthus annuus]
MEDNGNTVAVVVGLIDKATNSTKPDLDPRLLKSIKSVVRHSDSELRFAVENLMSLMKRDHSQVRYLTLTIIHELFMRSKLFRTLVVENLDQLLTLSVGFRRNQPLPAPPAIASKLRTKAIEYLEKWNTTFGIHYRQLRLGYDYLKNTLRYQFPNLQANAARIQQERRERELRTKEILLKKYELLKSNISSIKDEVNSIVDEISECLDILISSKEENVPLDPVDEEDFEDFRNVELRTIRENTLKEADKVQENSENKVVFDALRELYKLLVTKHLVAVQESISVLIRVELSDNRLRDSMLKEFIDIRNHLKSIKKKCEEAGCVLSTRENDEEEDIWEEGASESFNTSKLVTPDKPDKQNDSAGCSNSKPTNVKATNVKLKANPDMDPLKSKLMVEAPVMKWGSFLDNWGSTRGYMANQRGLEVEAHWGRVDHDAVIPANKIAELNVQATVYEEEHKEIQQCRAPLKKGGLCERRDLKVCPFHGPIIARDDEGTPLNQENQEPDTKNFSREELLNQAVKNVRERDKEVVKKREYDKKELKRAKLAKIRGHNEAVLRDAAIASTSVSSAVGESDLGREKDSLAKMLKKKATAKDRLATRLLNRKAIARQANLEDDHLKYREAFPNQW